MARYSLLLCLLLVALAPRPASAQKDFRAAVASLDRLDPAVGYALSIQREGTYLIAGAGAVFGASVLTGIIGVATGADWTDYAFAVGVPAGLGLAVAGLPAMLSSRKFLDFYIDAMPPPTELARLKLIRRWRMDLLKMRRDTGLIGAGVLGAAGLVSAIVWGTGSKGVTADSPFTRRHPSSGLLTMMFVTAAGSGALTALLSHLELDQERNRPHRVYQQPVQVGVAPLLTPREGRGMAVGVQGTVAIRF